MLWAAGNLITSIHRMAYFCNLFCLLPFNYKTLSLPNNGKTVADVCLPIGYCFALFESTSDILLALIYTVNESMLSAPQVQVSLAYWYTRTRLEDSNSKGDVVSFADTATVIPIISRTLFLIPITNQSFPLHISAYPYPGTTAEMAKIVSFLAHINSPQTSDYPMAAKVLPFYCNTVVLRTKEGGPSGQLLSDSHNIDISR